LVGKLFAEISLTERSQNSGVASSSQMELAQAQALLLFLTNERAVWSFSQSGPTRQSTQTAKNKQKGNGMAHRAKEIGVWSHRDERTF
jgi:hypothetical protein